MFEPIHGSAPDIAGRKAANPLAAIWSAAQMLDFLGYESWGSRIIQAIEKLLVSKENLTPDQGGTSTTEECTAALLKYL